MSATLTPFFAKCLKKKELTGLCYIRVLLGCESIGIIILPLVPLLAARERSRVEILLDVSSTSVPEKENRFNNKKKTGSDLVNYKVYDCMRCITTLYQRQFVMVFVKSCETNPGYVYTQNFFKRAVLFDHRFTNSPWQRERCTFPCQKLKSS